MSTLFRIIAAHAVAVGVAWSPASPIAWQDASNARFGRWFDPVAEFGPYPGSGDRARVLYLPPLDGNSMAPFAQWPGLADRGFNVRALALDLSSAAIGGDHAGLVRAVSDEAASLAAAAAPPLVLLGESMGGVTALAVALELAARGEARALAGVVTVNPATSFPMTDLPDVARRMSAMPDPLFRAASAWIFATRVTDAGQLGAIARTIFVDNPLNDPSRCPPALKAYFDGAIPAFAEGLAPPRPFYEARLASLGAAAAAVNEQLDGGGARADALLPPVLNIAGTADRLVGSRAEAARLEPLLRPRYSSHFVEGAGHSGTLDDRIDLGAVLDDWLDTSAATVAQ